LDLKNLVTDGNNLSIMPETIDAREADDVGARVVGHFFLFHRGRDDRGDGGSLDFNERLLADLTGVLENGDALLLALIESIFVHVVRCNHMDCSFVLYSLESLADLLAVSCAYCLS